MEPVKHTLLGDSLNQNSPVTFRVITFWSLWFSLNRYSMNFVLLKLMILQFFLFFFKYLKTNTNLDLLSLKIVWNTVYVLSANALLSVTTGSTLHLTYQIPSLEFKWFNHPIFLLHFRFLYQFRFSSSRKYTGVHMHIWAGSSTFWSSTFLHNSEN